MNDEALERELRAWYRAELDDTTVAPADLRADVLSIPTVVAPLRRLPTGRRHPTLLIAAAIATAAIVGSAIVGSSFLPTTPMPSQLATTPIFGPTPTPAASVTASPSTPPSSTPASVLGGGLILATLPHPGVRPCNTTPAPVDVVTVDPKTAETTLLGTTASTCDVRPFNARWAAGRTRIVLLSRYSPGQLDLASVTDAGRKLPVACCGLPTDVWQGGGGGVAGQLSNVSPRGDRIAAFHTTPSGAADAIVVADIDGQNSRQLPLPKGADACCGFDWSPDESAFAVSACLPCNTAQPGQPPTAVERMHLFIVPLDGSPVRALVDSARGSSAAEPAWAPDGSAIAVVVSPSQCAGAKHPPFCTMLATVDVATGSVHPVLTGADVGTANDFDAPSWAPDGQRIRVDVLNSSAASSATFAVDPDGRNLAKLSDSAVLAWSPDGQWFLVGRGTNGTDIWLESVDGAQQRQLGAFLGVDW